jgi:hypothetical protein
MSTEIEFTLMVEWPDGIEYVPAKDPEHAARMAKSIYGGHPSWTVGREIQPWRYVRPANAELTELVEPAQRTA